MAMVFCRGCGKRIHDSASVCPSCGAPQNNTVPTSQIASTAEGTLVIPIIALILSIVGCAAALDDSSWDHDTLIGCFSISVAGLIMGILSMKNQIRGKNMAIAAVILSVIGLLCLLGHIA